MPGAPGLVPEPPVHYFSGDHNSYSDPYNSFYRSAMDHRELSDGNLDAFRVDLDYTGSRRRQLPQGGHGSAAAMPIATRWPASRPTTGVACPSSGATAVRSGSTIRSTASPAARAGRRRRATKPFCFDNFFRDSVPNPMNGECRLFYGGNTVDQYQQMVEYANQINREWEPMAGDINGGWRSLYDRPNAIAGTPFTRGEINPQREKNKAAYAMLRFGKDCDNGTAVSGNVGIRYTHTNRVSSGYQEFQLPTSVPTDETCRDSINKRSEAPARSTPTAR